MANSRTHVLKAAGMTIAAAGSNSQTNSTQLTQNPVKMITTVSASSRGVRLPVPLSYSDSTVFHIFNNTAVNVKVYPATGSKIGSGATNAAYTLNANTGHMFASDASGYWRVI